MDMLEILQVAGIIGLLVFSCMRIWASNTAHFWGYNLVYAAAIFGICWAFFEAPPDEALIAALIATAVAHLLSALVTRRRTARSNTTARFAPTTATPTPAPSSTRTTTTTSTQPKTSTEKAAPAKPAAPKPAAPVTKPTTPVAKPASTEAPKPQQPKATSTSGPSKPKTTTPKPAASTQQPKAEKKEVKQTLTSCLKCGKTIASATCGYCRYNNSTGLVRLLCRVDPRKLQIKDVSSK